MTMIPVRALTLSFCCGGVEYSFHQIQSARVSPDSTNLERSHLANEIHGAYENDERYSARLAAVPGVPGPGENQRPLAFTFPVEQIQRRKDGSRPQLYEEERHPRARL